MEAAALVLLVAGVGGVDFGWQPMPDGSPRYEYLVQIEPEMLETLADGRSIPIAGDAPDEVHPIARVRVVVGRGALPRQLLVTQRKPSDDAGLADAGVVLTQYTETTGAPRYGTPPAGYDPYTQAPPAAAWNGGEAAAPGAAAGGTWNAGGPVAEFADNSAAQLQDGLQQVTEPLQQGINRLGDQFRSAADDLGARTGQMLDELGLPPRRDGQPAGAAGATPLSLPAPPAGGSWNAGADPNATAPPWNAGGGGSIPGASAAPVTPVTPVDAGVGSNWNGGNPGVAAPTLADEYRNQASPAASGAGGGNVAPPLVGGGGGGRGATVADPWDNASDPRFHTVAPGATAGGAGGSVAGGGGGFGGTAPNPGIPGFTNASTGGAGMTGPDLGFASGGSSSLPLVGRPSIDSAMLALPGDRPLEGVVDASPVTGAGAFDAGGFGSGAANPDAGAFPPATAGPPNHAGAPQNGSSRLNDQGWSADSPTTAGPSPADVAAANADSAQNKLLVLVAWVLLFASVAGNMYLFWSYLDVRTKYRALVRKTARAVGSRFSPA